MAVRPPAILRELGCVIAIACFCLSPPSGATQSQNVTNATASLQQSAKHPLCFDQIFFWALPGKTDYCLGLRDWMNGNYQNGLQFLKLSAGWGNKRAQYTLGMIYYGGRHVPVNIALGLAWLKLADERHNDPQIRMVTRSAIKWATPMQREHADRLFQDMRKQYGDKVAAVRAWHHLQHWKLSNYRTDLGCITLHGPQAVAALRAGIGVPGNNGVCVRLQVGRHVVRQTATRYFRGLFGTVTVGPLKAVPAPATSPDR